MKLFLSFPGSIGSKKDITMSWLYFKKLFFGQTLPVFNATGTHGKLSTS